MHVGLHYGITSALTLLSLFTHGATSHANLLVMVSVSDLSRIAHVVTVIY